MSDESEQDAIRQAQEAAARLQREADERAAAAAERRTRELQATEAQRVADELRRQRGS